MSAQPGHTGRLFGDIADTGRGALVGFLHVGYPSVEISLAAMRALTGEGDSDGVDLVEVGMPYSDPVIDGVTIQRAGTSALQRGVRTRDVFAAVEAVAEHRHGSGRDDVLEPDRALRTGGLRPRPGRGGRRRRHHPRPHPRRGGRMAGRLRRARTSTGSSSSLRPRGRAAGEHGRPPAAAGCTRPSVMGVTGRARPELDGRAGARPPLAGHRAAGPDRGRAGRFRRSSGGRGRPPTPTR